MPKIEYTDYYSNLLGTSMQIEITGHYGYPILMFPTSQGQFTQNHDFHLNESVNRWVEQGKIKLFNVQTIDGWSFYDKEISPYDRIHKYETWIQFIRQEYIPYLQRTHSTHRIGIAGASFGGYHAANIAFRFPDLISHLFCLSGSFSIRDFMDGYSEDTVYYNCPREFVKNDEAWKYRHMQIVLSTSNWDICLEQTKEMSGILNSKGIDHWYDERMWIKHDWPLWRMVFPRFIEAYFN